MAAEAAGPMQRITGGGLEGHRAIPRSGEARMCKRVQETREADRREAPGLPVQGPADTTAHRRSIRDG